MSLDNQILSSSIRDIFTELLGSITLDESLSPLERVKVNKLIHSAMTEVLSTVRNHQAEAMTNTQHLFELVNNLHKLSLN